SSLTTLSTKSHVLARQGWCKSKGWAVAVLVPPSWKLGLACPMQRWPAPLNSIYVTQPAAATGAVLLLPTAACAICLCPFASPAPLIRRANQPGPPSTSLDRRHNR
ncbi:hypothetical protein EJ04DRAFT_602030, partial [Polyplosphaeria fusca]